MNGDQLVRRLASASRVSIADTRRVLANLRELLERPREVGESVRMPGVGTWRVSEWRGRKVLHGGVWHEIPPRTVLTFRAAKRLRGL